MQPIAAERPSVHLLWPVPAFALGAALAVWLADANVSLFRLINGFSAWLPAGLLLALTLLGNTVASIALVSGWVASRPRLLWAVLFALLPGMLFVRGFKLWLNLPRPPAVLSSDMLTVIGPAYRSYSFPSGHSTTAFAFAAIVCCLNRDWRVRTLALLLAGGVVISRVLVGVHWPLDILGAMAGGWLIGCLGAWLALRTRWVEDKAARRIAAVMVIIAGIALLRQHYDLPAEQTLGWLLGVIALVQGLPPLFGRKPPVNF
jgi:membrane-associated phospholipid phosphatase